MAKYNMAQGDLTPDGLAGRYHPFRITAERWIDWQLFPDRGMAARLELAALITATEITDWLFARDCYVGHYLTEWLARVNGGSEWWRGGGAMLRPFTHDKPWHHGDKFRACAAVGVYSLPSRIVGLEQFDSYAAYETAVLAAYQAIHEKRNNNHATIR